MVKLLIQRKTRNYCDLYLYRTEEYHDSGLVLMYISTIDQGVQTLAKRLCDKDTLLKLEHCMINFDY